MDTNLTRKHVVGLGVATLLITASIGALVWSLMRPTEIDTASVDALKESISRAEAELTPGERDAFRKALFVVAYPMKLEAMPIQEIIKLPPPTPPQLETIDGKTAQEVVEEAQQLYKLGHSIRLLGIEKRIKETEFAISRVRAALAELGKTGPMEDPKMVAINSGPLSTAHLTMRFANRTPRAIEDVMLKWRMFVPSANGIVASGDIMLRFDEPLLPGSLTEVDETISGYTAERVAAHISPEAKYVIDVARVTWAGGDVLDVATLWSELPADPEQALKDLRQSYEEARNQVPVL